MPKTHRILVPALLLILSGCVQSSGFIGGSAGFVGSGSSGPLVAGATPDGGSGTGGGSTAGFPGGPGPTYGGCRILPPNSPWNTDISNYPLAPRSNDYIASLGPSTGLHPDFGTVWNGGPNGWPIVLVPGDQPRLPVSFTYAAESDPGPYALPTDEQGIQGGPQGTGDRHLLVIETGTCTLYELFEAYFHGDHWTAGSGAIWHLNADERRPDRSTSADAAGLPMMPGLVRYDEVMEKGEILHAVRMSARNIQAAFVYPATHSDGTAGSDPSKPPMGTRLRLKANFDVSAFPPPLQVVLRAMKKYGIIVADTGFDWYVCGAPDPRWDDRMLAGLSAVKGSDFEAVDTGPLHPF